MKMVIMALLLRCATVHYPNTEQLKHSDCTVNPFKYLEENQDIPFHNHHQACLFITLVRTRLHY